MAYLKIVNWEVREDEMVKMSLYIFADGVEVPEALNDNVGSLRHYELLLSAQEVLDAFELEPAARGARMLELVKEDPVIQGVILSERAQALLNASYTPPFVAEF